MRVVIIGGSGLIGSKLVTRLWSTVTTRSRCPGDPAASIPSPAKVSLRAGDAQVGETHFEDWLSAYAVHA
jgi:uncharacterized protein YbjT (DUF2867 family)